MPKVPQSRFKRLFPDKDNKTNGPEARSGHRIVVDDGNIYCYGGYNPLLSSMASGRNMEEFPMFRELWKFNLASKQWTRLNTTGQMPRESASYACVLLNQKLFVNGGTGFPFAEVRSNLLYCCDLVTLHWTILRCRGTPPDEVYGHSMLYLNGYIYLFGGTTGFFYNNDIYRLDMELLEWKLLHRPSVLDSAPNPRYRHEMATDGRCLYIFGGGTSSDAEPLKTVWAFDLIARRWNKISSKPDDIFGFPTPRKCHGCVQQGDYVFITGGLGEGTSVNAYNDAWRFHMPSCKWDKLPLTLRKELYFHATAISPSGSLYTFGGVLARSQRHDDTVDRRSKALYKVDLNVKSLGEISWEKIAEEFPHFLRIPSRELLKYGVPHHYISRLDNNTALTQIEHQVALAS